MKIKDLALRTGLSTHTIRYYERIGLLPQAMRGRSGHREYDASVLPWIEFLGRLKTTGMGIRDMVRYAGLRAQGPGNVAERSELLVRHRERVRAHLAELDACLFVLDAKIATYEGMDETHGAGTTRRERTVRAGPARPR